jgi:peroxiredoxin
MKRTETAKLKGNFVTLKGRELKVGDAAPDFCLQDNALGDVSLAASAG